MPAHNSAGSHYLSPAGRIQLGITALRMQAPASALPHLLRAAELSPEHNPRRALKLYRDCLLRLERFEDLEDAATTALKAHSN